MNKFTAPFIKSKKPFNCEEYASFPSPIFRRKFVVEKEGKAQLDFCGLGFGYCYINGEKVTEDLFISPFSEYDKAVWYNRYDVSSLLHKGENIIAVILGNGFYNENFPSSWGTSKLSWRDNPKFALSLIIDGNKVLESDEEFLYTDDSFVVYNQIRGGETFDARLYKENWNKLDFDDSDFDNAIIDKQMSNIKRELCLCEPIREIEEYDFVSAKKTEEGYLLDFGVNISGYLRVNVEEKTGTVIEMFHAEEANEDGTLKLNRLNIFYDTIDFQTDRYICGEKNYSWSPKFTYHGFRFVLVKGLTHKPVKGQFKSIFVHQDVARKSDFLCSDELINKIYNAGIRSTYSNMHYMLTDCPTREKLGWLNDAQASLGQIYINFAVKKFMQKWGRDILNNVNDKGEVTGVVPAFFTAKGFGPVVDGCLYELPFIDYLYTADNTMLIEFLPFMEKNYDFLNKKDLDRSDWLGDWDGHKSRMTDFDFVLLFYKIKLCKIILLAYEKAGIVKGKEKYESDISVSINELKRRYIDNCGKSLMDSQTVISMLICLNAYDNKALLEQLKTRIEKDNYHLTCGMLGLQYIYRALFENDLGDYAYRLITYKGMHTFSYWFDNDSTTLWESWEEGHTDSRNHHMLSNVLEWFFRGFLGINADIQAPGYEKIILKPSFAQGLDFCKGWIETPYGKIYAEWKREDIGIRYNVTIPEGVSAMFGNKMLNVGKNEFII